MHEMLLGISVRFLLNKISQSNLETGRVATLAGGRPTHSRRSQSFNRIRQVAPICTPAYDTRFLDSPDPSAKRHSRFSTMCARY